MLTVKCTFSDGNTITTDINGTIEEVKKYYLNNWFNLGVVDDDMQKCINVEQIQ